MKLRISILAALCFVGQVAYASEFEPALEKVILPHEGGFQKIHSDNGNWTGCKVGKGELKGTKGGISACTYPNEDIANLTPERIASIYKRDFWDKYHLGNLRLQITADRILDAMVNNGPIAAIWACKANNRANGKRADVKVSTDLTAAKIDEINRTDQSRFLLCFLGYRFLRYDSLADKFPQFFGQWLDREVDEVITAVHERDDLLKGEGRGH